MIAKKDIAFDLAMMLKDGLYQQSFSIENPNELWVRP
jgi:hypothetical protein